MSGFFGTFCLAQRCVQELPRFPVNARGDELRGGGGVAALHSIKFCAPMIASSFVRRVPAFPPALRATRGWRGGRHAFSVCRAILVSFERAVPIPPSLVGLARLRPARMPWALGEEGRLRARTLVPPLFLWSASTHLSGGKGTAI